MADGKLSPSVRPRCGIMEYMEGDSTRAHGVNFTRPKVTMAPADLLDRSRGARGDFFT